MIVLTRAFYSGHDTRTPVFTALLDMVVFTVVAVATAGSLGLSGIALGLSAGGWAEAGALAVLLWRRMPGVGVESIVRPLVVFVVGAILAGLATLFVVRFTDPLIGPSPGKVALLFQLLAAGGVGALVYGLYPIVLHIPELEQSLGMLRSSLHRR